MRAVREPRQSASLTWTMVVAGVVFLLAAAPGVSAQAPDDAKRVSLEAKVAVLQPLACAAPAVPPDPQVAVLKTVLDEYVKQYGAVLDAQMAVLTAHTAPSLSSDDQDVMAAVRKKKRDALGNVCAAAALGIFTGPNGAVAAAPAPPPPSPADKFDITPAVVRVSDKAIEVSEQADSSVTLKNNSDGEVRLGVAEVCLEDKSVCKPQGEVFQVADGVDKCKNPLASKDQCTLKIVFTPHRSFNYNQWLKVPIVDGGGQPMKKPDGKNVELMIPLQGQGFVADMAHVEAKQANANNPALRSVVGVDIGGATATDTQQKLFVDFGLNAPIGLSGYTVCSDSKGEALTDRHGRVLQKARFAANIAKISRDSNIVTVLTKSPHNLGAGDRVLITGASDKGFDGEFVVASVADLTGFTYAQNGQNANGKDNQGSVSVSPTSKFPAGWVIRSYDDCQDLRTAKEQTNHVRYIWKDQHADPLNSRVWGFFNPRITSIPQPASALSSLNVQGFSDIFSAQKTSLVQGVDVQGGFEIMLVKPRDGRAFYGSFKNTKGRLGLAWVLGGGFASPFAAPGTNPTVFTLATNSPLRHQFQASGTQFCGAPPATSPCDIPASFTNITFVNEERSRFFRKYYSGLRLKTYHFSKSYLSNDCDPGFKGECEGVYNAYPGIMDLTVGQDEQVTGGHLSNWLLRLDVAYPLPFLPGTFIFGGVNSAFTKNKNTDPVFLPGTSTTPISDPSVFQVKVPLRDRDNYHLGLGVDLLQVITQAKQGSNKNPAGTGTTPAANSTADSAKQN